MSRKPSLSPKDTQKKRCPEELKTKNSWNPLDSGLKTISNHKMIKRTNAQPQETKLSKQKNILRV